jgi:hypothetical protein
MNEDYEQQQMIARQITRQAQVLNEHEEMEREYLDAARLYRYQVHFDRPDGPIATFYLANDVQVTRTDSGMYELVLTDVWAFVVPPRIRRTVRAVCSSYIVSEYARDELPVQLPDDWATGAS